MPEYSTEKISSKLLEEIVRSIEGKQYGSIEIFIENGKVTHITERVIRKYQQVTPAKNNSFNNNQNANSKVAKMVTRR